MSQTQIQPPRTRARAREIPPSTAEPTPEQHPPANPDDDDDGDDIIPGKTEEPDDQQVEEMDGRARIMALEEQVRQLTDLLQQNMEGGRSAWRSLQQGRGPIGS